MIKNYVAYDSAEEGYSQVYRHFDPDRDYQEQTRLIYHGSQSFFDKAQGQIDFLLSQEKEQELAAFLEEYMVRCPTLGEYLYQIVFLNSNELQQTYTDYTLQTRINGQNGIRGQYCHFYNKLISDRLETMSCFDDPVLTLCKNQWKNYLKEKCFLIANRNNANKIRQSLICLAFALELDPGSVEQILCKGLLMRAFDPRDPWETISYYCLKRQISYSEMLERFLTPFESMQISLPLSKQQIIDLTNEDTVNMMQTLESLTGMDENEFTEYLEKLKTMQILAQSKGTDWELNLKKRTAGAIFWEHFCHFPKQLYLPPEGYPRVYLTENELWGKTAFRHTSPKAPEEYRTFSEIYGVIQEENRRKKEEKKESANSETEDQEEKTEDIKEGHYQRILCGILKASRENYYAANREQLLPNGILKELFRGLNFTKDTVRDWYTGEKPVERNVLICAAFLDFCAENPDILQRYRVGKNADYLSKPLFLFEEMVSTDLFDCGMMTFYERNPFELFLHLCFLRKDPLAYFMASWEKAIREK